MAKWKHRNKATKQERKVERALKQASRWGVWMTPIHRAERGMAKALSKSV